MTMQVPDSDAPPVLPALSIRQPWAWLVAGGHKDVENRPRAFRYRGPILIHAGKAVDAEADYEARVLMQALRIRWPDTYDRGGVIGAALLVDCVTQHRSRWFAGPFGLVLASAIELPFRPIRGQLGLFGVQTTAAEWAAVRALSRLSG